MLALSEFERRLRSLRDDRSRILESLRGAAHSIREDGQPPSLETVDEFQFYRQRYIDLQQALAPEEEVNEAKLPTLDQFEVYRQRMDKIAELSTAILRVTQLNHVDPEENGLLDPVNESARALVEKLHDNPTCEEVQSFEVGTHPVAIVLRMCESLDSLSDVEWEVFEKRIGEEWGRPVAVAAARGRIVFKSTI